ncbi:MAG: hypothetical protein AAGA08_05760 [Pseudomonadota bacterium]
MSWTAAPTTLRRLKTRTAPKTPPAPSLSELFSDVAWDAAGIGFLLSRLPDGAAPVLWVQDRISRIETGVPYLPGMGAVSMLRVAVNRPVDALWAMEEGLRCAGLRAVVGEIWGDPPALSFTATKRLAMRAESSGVPCWLLRRAAVANLSAARDRWRVGAVPSARYALDPQAPGAPRWQAELFRSRHAQPGIWVATYDRATDRVDLAAPVRDGAMDARDDKQRSSATG